MEEPTRRLARRTAIGRMAAAAAVTALPLFATSTRAHTDKPHAPRTGPVRKEQKDWGIAGEAKNVKRTIQVSMTDNMRFTPERVQVRLGETVRFAVRNSGKDMHEFVIGTLDENAEHAALMKKFPNMEHDEPYMAHVPPGESGEIIWTFNRAGTFEFACLVDDHYDLGMSGLITVAPAGKA